MKYPDFHWVWIPLSRNPNITFQNVIENLDKPWDWYHLSMNLFEKDPRLIKKKGERAIKSIHARKIQKAWNNYWYAPNSKGIARICLNDLKKMKEEGLTVIQ